MNKKYNNKIQTFQKFPENSGNGFTPAFGFLDFFPKIFFALFKVLSPPKRHFVTI